eukprot:scaffold19909_cov130-Isochrysis_galbana.AAC.10
MPRYSASSFPPLPPPSPSDKLHLPPGTLKVPSLLSHTHTPATPPAPLSRACSGPPSPGRAQARAAVCHLDLTDGLQSVHGAVRVRVHPDPAQALPGPSGRGVPVQYTAVLVPLLAHLLRPVRRGDHVQGVQGRTRPLSPPSQI